MSGNADRQARIAEIRRQIAADIYETPTKIAAAVEKMLARMNGEQLPQIEGGQPQCDQPK